MPDFAQSHDFMSNSPTLRTHGASRCIFDPTNAAHLESFDHFLRTGNWGTTQFLCEAPYIDVPMTILMKFAMHTRGVRRETIAERNERFSFMILAKMVPNESREERYARLAETNKKLLAAV
jgi:hypothetical protein